MLMVVSRRLLNGAVLASCFLANVKLGWGGTGWVGNSPMMFASNDSNVVLSSLVPGIYDRNNLLLLGKGESRLSVGFGFGGQQYTSSGDVYVGTQGVFGFDYGLTENLTLLNLTALGYNLKGGGPEDHHFALYFGVTGGVGYSSSTGLQVGPGIGVSHTVGVGKWRFSNSMGVSGQYKSKKSEFLPTDYNWESIFARLRLGVGRQIGENWAMGFSAESVIGEYTRVESRVSDGQIDEFRVSRERVTVPVLANPNLSLTRNLFDGARLTWSLGANEAESTIGNPSMGTHLALTVQW